MSNEESATQPPCEHIKLEMEECDQHVTGMDIWKCLACGQLFEARCAFTWPIGPERSPWEQPRPEELTPIAA